MTNTEYRHDLSERRNALQCRMAEALLDAGRQGYRSAEDPYTTAALLLDRPDLRAVVLNGLTDDEEDAVSAFPEFQALLASSRPFGGNDTCPTPIHERRARELEEVLNGTPLGGGWFYLAVATPKPGMCYVEVRDEEGRYVGYL